MSHPSTYSEHSHLMLSFFTTTSTTSLSFKISLMIFNLRKSFNFQLPSFAKMTFIIVEWNWSLFRSMLNCVNNLNLEPQSMNSGIERAALMVSEEKHHQDSRKISHHEHFELSHSIIYHFHSRKTQKISKFSSSRSRFVSYASKWLLRHKFLWFFFFLSREH